MTILLLDTALPLALGSPRQRAADARRHFLGQSDDVASLTIDLWQSEWPARSRMAVGDRLLSIARVPHRTENLLALAWLARSTPLERSDLGAPIPLSLPLDEAVVARAAALSANVKPNRIVIADPLLAPLCDALSSKGVPCEMVATPSADWHRHMASLLNGSPASLWHGLLAKHLGKVTNTSGEAIAFPPMQFEWDPGFLTKSRSILVPATGYAWLDEHILGEISRRGLSASGSGDDDAEIVLMGFAAADGAAIQRARVFVDWQHLSAMTATASAVFVPFLTDGLRHLADAARSVGTPVILTGKDAEIHGLAGAPGVLAIPGIAQASSAFAIAMRANDPDSDFHRRIVDCARTSDVVPQSPFAKRRVGALVGRPEIIYNPLSRMLLIRANYRSRAQVEEVRLIGAEGRELNRLMPNTKQRALDIVPLEGGMVINPGDLDDGIRLELHDIGGEVETLFVPIADFVTLEAEFACLDFDGSRLRGSFWTTDEVESNRLGVGTARYRNFLPQGTGQPLDGLDARFYQFDLPLKPLPREELMVWSQSSAHPDGVPDPLVQRAYRTAPALVEAAPTLSSELASLKDKHKGERAWILGNGPSVRFEDLAAIPDDDIVFGFNRFYLSYADHPLREDYVVSSDTLMIEDFGQEMIDVATGRAIFCTNPASVAGLKGDFVYVTPNEGTLPIFTTNPAKGLCPGGSSVYVALQMAHYMGIREVVLYGIDYSFSMKLKRDPRFPFPVSFDEGNHFIKSYRAAKPWCPPTWRDISASFLNARIGFESTGGRIVNATRGGRLETFPRGDFDDLVKAERQPIIGDGEGIREETVQDEVAADSPAGATGWFKSLFR